MRRTVVLVLALALLVAFPAAARGKKGKRIHIPLEEFLPADTLAFLSLPDGKTALEVLKRAGEDRKALAARIALGTDVKAGVLATHLELLAAMADGPLTVSLHRETDRHGDPRIAFVASASTRKPGNEYKEAGKGLLTSVLLPLYGEKVRVEKIMEVPVAHVQGEGKDVYHAALKGYLLYSNSPLTLGRVLREMQTPTGKTLRHTPEYERGREAAGAEKGDGFLLLRDPSLLPLPEALGVASAAGVLARDGSGFRDEVVLVSREDGLLARLGEARPVPGAWAGAGGKGAWIGAALDPAAVQTVVVSLLDPAHAPLAAFLEEAAAGEVEVLLGDGQPPCIRIPLRDGVDPAEAARPFGDLARTEGSVLFLAADPAALEGRTDAAPRGLPNPGALAVVKAPVPLLLGFLGRGGAAGGRRTAWVVRPDEAGVRVTSGRAELGPFQAAAAALCP